MYDLPYHKERDREVVQAFVREHPFAMLMGCGPQGFPVATLSGSHYLNQLRAEMSLPGLLPNQVREF